MKNLDEKKFMKHFASKLLKYMELAQINQTELARLTDLPKGTICRYLNCLRSPDAYHVHIIAKALCISSELLID